MSSVAKLTLRRFPPVEELDAVLAAVAAAAVALSPGYAPRDCFSLTGELLT
jgi:hypothetical protein